VRSWLRLSDAVRAEGYDFTVDPQPWTRTDITGNPDQPETFHALLCGNTLVATSDSWDWAYGASHEIAEDRHGHHHTERMWCEQANILAKWCRTLATAEAT